MLAFRDQTGRIIAFIDEDMKYHITQGFAMDSLEDVIDGVTRNIEFQIGALSSAEKNFIEKELRDYLK
jgi:hypothetical protein